MLVRKIGVGRQYITERAHRLDLRLHRQQHAADIGVVNDRYAVAAPPPYRSALDPLPSIVARRLIGAFGDPQALQSDLLPGLVHHREHMRQALVFLAHQVANGTLLLAKAHHAGGARMNAKLVLDRRTHDVVAFRQRAVSVVQKFGHQEQ